MAVGQATIFNKGQENEGVNEEDRVGLGSKNEATQIKAYSIEKAVEAFKYSQQIPLLDLAKSIEIYLLGSVVNPT